MATQLATLVYGSSATDDDTKAELEETLKASFKPRESSYRGGAYWMGSTDQEGETIIVQRNAELDGPVEPAELPTIVYVERTPRASQMIARLESESLVFIRKDDWHDRGSPCRNGVPPCCTSGAVRCDGSASSL